MCLLPATCHVGCDLATHDHIKRGRRHPLKTGGVNQHVYRVFGTVMYHAAFVDLADSAGCRIHQMHMGQVKRWQVLVMKGRSLTPVGVVGLKRAAAVAGSSTMASTLARICSMMRKLLSNCRCTNSSGLICSACSLRSLKSATFPAR